MLKPPEYGWLLVILTEPRENGSRNHESQPNVLPKTKSELSGGVVVVGTH
jgi:hypothetical protein